MDVSIVGTNFGPLRNSLTAWFGNTQCAITNVVQQGQLSLIQCKLPPSEGGEVEVRLHDPTFGYSAGVVTFTGGLGACVAAMRTLRTDC